MGAPRTFYGPIEYYYNEDPDGDAHFYRQDPTSKPPKIWKALELYHNPDPIEWQEEYNGLEDPAQGKMKGFNRHLYPDTPRLAALMHVPGTKSVGLVALVALFSFVGSLIRRNWRSRRNSLLV